MYLLKLYTSLYFIVHITDFILVTNVDLDITLVIQRLNSHIYFCIKGILTLHCYNTLLVVHLIIPIHCSFSVGINYKYMCLAC